MVVLVPAFWGAAFDGADPTTLGALLFARRLVENVWSWEPSERDDLWHSCACLWVVEHGVFAVSCSVTAPRLR